MPWPPSTADLLDMVEGGVFHRSDGFRFELLDQDWAVIGELHPSAESPPTMSNDTSRTIIRTVDNLTLPASEAQAIDTMTDRMRPVMILQNGAERPLGVFTWAQDNRPQRAWGTEHVSSLRDQTFDLLAPRGRVSSTKKGANLLVRAQDHAALRIPRERMLVLGASAATAAAPMVWPPDDPLSDIVNAHLHLAGYLPAHFNHDGMLVFRPAATDLDDVAPDIVEDAGGRIIADSMLDSDDTLDAPNVYLVVETSGQGPPIVGRYQVPASAPHSVENRGYEVVKPVQVQGIPSAAPTLRVSLESQAGILRPAGGGTP